CKAQNVENTEIRMALPNIAKKDFFVENPNVKSLVIEYREGKSFSLEVYYHIKDNKHFGADEVYDLTFPGDQYRLRQRYKPSDYLSYPKVGLINETISIKPSKHK